MLIRFTIPNDYGSKDDFDRLVQIVADWLDVTRDDIDESDIWQYLFSKLPSGSKLVGSDEFSQVWAVPSDVDVDGFWKTVIAEIVALAVIMSEVGSNEDVYNVCRQIMTKLLDVEIEPKT